MPRRGAVVKREKVADPLYQSVLVTQFINNLMRSGKKSTAQKIFYGSMDIIQSKKKEDPMKVFKKAMDNVKPVLEVKSRRVGGANYQIPVEVHSERRISLAIRWIISYAKQRGGNSMRQNLADEILDAADNKGAAIKKKEDTHRMAEANKAFAHYRW